MDETQARKTCTAAELALRVGKVEELLCLALSRAQIQTYVKEKTNWGISDAQLDRYIHKATEAIEGDCAIHRKREIAKAKRRLEDLYSKSIRIQDYKTCLSIQKEMSTLFKLYDAPEEKKEKPVLQIVTIDNPAAVRNA